MATNFSKELIVKPGHKVQLRKYDPGDTLDWEKGHATKASLAKTLERLNKLQYLLYADHKHALLVVVQGLDAAGKDGTIRHVMSLVNPQGCRVTSFKTPSAEEAAHDFLWRVHKAVPPYGDIGIFNRSHYEDVLVVRVHDMVPKDVWRKRYDQINRFEAILHENNVRILKFFLHISKDEQRRRFDERNKDPNKNWKSSESDERERRFWDPYQAAYQDALERTSKKHAPWFVIPSNQKWFRNLAISHILVKTLEDLNLQYPRAAKATPKKAGKR
jgi:PPK2 family polyphosphate:nucleotide phosphotransferase